jgi:hypothetical protein
MAQENLFAALRAAFWQMALKAGANCSVNLVPDQTLLVHHVVQNAMATNGY